MPLRTIARCLRGMASMFFSGSAIDRLAERDVQVLAGPVRVAALAVAHLEVIHAKPTREVAGRSFERRVGHLVRGDDAAVDAERS